MKNIKLTLIAVYLFLFYISSIQAEDSNNFKSHRISFHTYLNKHNQNFNYGMMSTLGYERVFNRWFGLGGDISYNRASYASKDCNNIDCDNAPFPSQTSSFMFDIKPQFYMLNNEKKQF